jgi:DNA processing protein
MVIDQRREEAAFAASLAALPGMGPATLVAILSEQGPAEAWEAIRAGRLVRPERRPRPSDDQMRFPSSASGGGARRAERRPMSWSAAAGRMDPVRAWAAVAAKGVRVTWWGGPAYPEALVGDPQPPGVLFWVGELAALTQPRVAIVGTRSATPGGRSVALEMGYELCAAGVCVVSGLALGIDGAAHAGVIRAMREGAGAGPVGVAASGVDVPYPPRHARLWTEVARYGAVISETPPGRPAQAWRFPARNRVIAGLAQMVVVVESHTTGGSLITAEAAIERGVDVRVVPGPVQSPASAGTNQLLYDGPGPVRDARDVLDGLGLLRPDPSPTERRGSSARGGAAPLDRSARRLLELIGWTGATVALLVERSGLGPPAVAQGLEHLAAAGLVTEKGGWWSRLP